MKSLANFLEAYQGAQEKERRAKQIQQGKIQPTKNATPQAANTGADAVTATHGDPSPNKWPSCLARPADRHLVALSGAIATTSRTT